ncbi:hypothetical protein SARC_01564 [Sphaeroforma arctica JP610]|uniref:Uncharacterized protein n=1 Tax=Sphaeroforma arctica JP610 TaxID=667725 RepID=A0A0L0GBA7_9EUKA|nr:hypothetical protein SARC_01564 [Sphaeroforma arctica JP610]KNC86302.1 hypothetical protein SARC_01564 [Sphaeroforma arctica JP610]|eukprot:XP_014160204.1 hypothetical protein SARC_01564 [Sphaeroforma arctica JP610]
MVKGAQILPPHSNRLGNVLAEEYRICGSFDLPPIVLRPDVFSLAIWESLERVGIAVEDVRILGSVAALIVADADRQHSIRCNDIDIVFNVDFEYHSAIVKFDHVLNCVMECLREHFPEEKREEGQNLPVGAFSSAYVNKMVKVPNHKSNSSKSDRNSGNEDCWSLISLRNESGLNIELKFVQNLRRHCEFSMDSVQIVLTKEVLQASAKWEVMSGWPENVPVNAVSVWGNYEEAVEHINQRIISINLPEQLRGGGLLKYCRLLSEGYSHPAEMTEKSIRKLQRSMCTRYFIDFPTLALQHNYIVGYIHSHFPDPRLGLKYLQHLQDAVVSYTKQNPKERASTIEVLDVLMQHTSEYIDHIDSMESSLSDSSSSSAGSESPMAPSSEENLLEAIVDGDECSTLKKLTRSASQPAAEGEVVVTKATTILGLSKVAKNVQVVHGARSFAKIVATNPVRPSSASAPVPVTQSDAHSAVFTPPRSPTVSGSNTKNCSGQTISEKSKKSKKTIAQGQIAATEFATTRRDSDGMESSTSASTTRMSTDSTASYDTMSSMSEKDSDSSTTVLLYPSPPDTPEMVATPMITLEAASPLDAHRASDRCELECSTAQDVDSSEQDNHVEHDFSETADVFEYSIEAKEEVFASCRESMVATDNLVTLRGLLNKGIVNVNDRGYLGNDKSEGQTLLMVASKYGRYKCMKELVDKFGADINMVGGVGSYTALHYAAFHGHVNAVVTLLERGAKTDMITSQGETPAQAALAGGKKEIARMLQSYANNGGRGPVDSTCMDGWQQCGRKSKGRRKAGVTATNNGGGNNSSAKYNNHAKGHNNVRNRRMRK